VHIDLPSAGSTVSVTVTVAGWAIDNVSAIGTVDATVVGAADYRAARPDACAAYPGRPGCPNVGFTYLLDTGSLSPGTHTLTVIATNTGAIPGSASTTTNVTH
jgi:hypothetical protein